MDKLNGFTITNADGSPVDYDALGMKYKDQICYCDIDGFYIGEDGQLVLMDDCGASVSVDREDYVVTWNRRADGWVSEMNDAVYALSQALCIGGLGEMRNAASDVWRIWDTKNEPQPPKKGE